MSIPPEPIDFENMPAHVPGDIKAAIELAEIIEAALCEHRTLERQTRFQGFDRGSHRPWSPRPKRR